MALENPPGVLDDEETPSIVQRHSTAALGGNRQGVVGSGDFAVSQSSTPAMTVRVASGYALVAGTVVANQGPYTVHNDAAVDDVAIAAGDPTNPRNDIVGLLVTDETYSGSGREVSFHVVQGTPAAVPSDPALPNSFLPLARVRVDANESTSIVNGDITDLRVFASSTGAPIVCTSSTRPPSPRVGQQIWETDTSRLLVHDGSNWVVLTASGTWAPTLTNFTIGTGGGAGVNGSYKYVNGILHIDVVAVLGTSGQSVGGSVTFTLPSTFTPDRVNTNTITPLMVSMNAGGTLVEGNAYVTSAGPPASVGVFSQVISSSRVTRQAVGASAPGTWAAGNLFSVQGAIKGVLAA